MVSTSRQSSFGTESSAGCVITPLGARLANRMGHTMPASVLSEQPKHERKYCPETDICKKITIHEQ